MMFRLLFILVFISMSFMSCSPERNEEFCSCLEVTEKLNDQSSKILNGEVSENDIEEQIRLRKEKDSVCDAFKEMDGPTMQDLKKACEEK